MFSSGSTCRGRSRASTSPTPARWLSRYCTRDLGRTLSQKERRVPDSVTTVQETRDAIDREIAIRTKAYQTEIARFQAANANLTNLGAALPHTPLAMLAHGDSWFD